MNSLRAILGAQFTEKEGERIIKNTWNEADVTGNNQKRLERLVSDLTAKSKAKDGKSLFYEGSGGTLSGFKPASQRREFMSRNQGREGFNQRKEAQQQADTSGGLINKAHASEQQPRTIMQHGHSYTLNPQTGKYE